MSGTSMTLNYAEEREANIRRNKLCLLELGSEKLVPRHEPKEEKRVKGKRSRLEINQEIYEPPRKIIRTEEHHKTVDGRRRSHRIATGTTASEQSRGIPRPLVVKNGVSHSPRDLDSQRKHNPKTYGHIPGIEVGTWWAAREKCSKDAVHAPWVAGIAPGKDGAYSVALSGGYDDDVDNGYAFTYTGAGGRDLKGTKAAPKNLRTAEQSSNQTFDNNNNKALLRSVKTGKPVRVIRGFKLQSKYGPSEGYRYDGLYYVKKAWTEPGLNKGGFLVCKFAFIRQEGQPHIPVNPDKAGELTDQSDRDEDQSTHGSGSDVDAD